MSKSKVVSHSNYCALDGVPQTTSNQLFAEMLVKTHCALAADFDPDLGEFLQEYYNKYGLVDTIRNCSLLADAIIRHYNDDGQFSSFESDYETASLFHGQGHLVMTLIRLRDTSIPHFGEMLQILRFAKRFGYPKGGSLPGIDKVLDINRNHQKKMQDILSCWASYYLGGGKFGTLDPSIYTPGTMYLSKPIARIPLSLVDEYWSIVPPEELNLTSLERQLLDLAGYYYCSALRHIAYYCDDTNAHFSNGAAADSPKHFKDKVARLSDCIPGMLQDEVMYPFQGNQVDHLGEYLEGHIAVLSEVPKDYKSKRVVAMEPVVINYFSRIFRVAFEKFFDHDLPKEMIPYARQEAQQEKILEGTLRHASGRNGFCSIDLSGASDSIPAWHIFYALDRGDEFADFHVRATKLQLDKDSNKYIKSYIYLTSGNALTWHHEGLWFLCLSLAAMDVQDFWTGKRATLGPSMDIVIAARKHAKDIAIYGDDIAVTSQYYDSIISCFQVLGYTVNINKSFDGYFAESCGLDAFKGIDVTSSYWPRKLLTWNPNASWKKGKNAETISSLVSLQHKFFGTSCGDLIEQFVLRLAPGMTYSNPYSECSDLWGYKPQKLVAAPHLGKVPFELTEMPENVGVTLPQAWTRSIHYTIISTISDKSVYNKGWYSPDLDMYLYYRWLKERDRNPNPVSDYPAFTWIDGIRYDAITTSMTDADLLLTDSVSVYVKRTK